MPTREQIIEAADQLFYQQGFDHTSFADIAGAVDISRGNFYYHFKTKDEILGAVIGMRLSNTAGMIEEWELENADPLARILCYVRILETNWSKIRLHGCPVGTLCGELAKLQHAAEPEAAKIFTMFRTWLARQFCLLGLEAEADDLAMQVLAWSQGVATLANAFGDKKFMRREVARMSEWLTQLTANKRKV